MRKEVENHLQVAAAQGAPGLQPKEGALPEPVCRAAHCGWRGRDWDW